MFENLTSQNEYLIKAIHDKILSHIEFIVIIILSVIKIVEKTYMFILK